MNQSFTACLPPDAKQLPSLAAPATGQGVDIRYPKIVVEDFRRSADAVAMLTDLFYACAPKVVQRLARALNLAEAEFFRQVEGKRQAGYLLFLVA